MRDKKQINDFKTLLEKLDYFTDEEKNKVKQAYEFASLKHIGQKRMSGEDYIIHPLNVAFILSEIKADCDSICASLLHDTIEDCNVTKEEISEKFNEEVASLVDSLTKINRLNLSGDSDAVIENQKKILIGMTKDVRAIILKLADRLHNMRTIWALSEESQKKNAKETLDILTPIAHRLGMFGIKSELEDLSLRYLKPEAYYQIVEKLNSTKLERDTYVVKMIEAVSNALNKVGINHKIKGRSKSIFSIYKKLDKGRSFDDIYDLLALRIFVNTDEQCYQTLGIIHSKYKPIPKRFKDFVANPKTNMYQSLHTTVFGIDSMIFEVQIRTYEMDKIAENGIASHWSYKEGRASMQNNMENKLQFFRVIMDLKDDDANEFVESVKTDALNDSVYVFTPEGDVIELPVGSTPIDFAYRVHTRVGETMVGAIVNNSIVPLDYKLKSDDIVKINTNKNSTPNKEWLNIVKTQQAKNKIKSYFSKLAKEDYIKKGEDLLNKELRKRKITHASFFNDENITKITNLIKCSDLTEIYIALGSGKVKLDSIFDKKEEVKKEDILKIVKKPEINDKHDILVKGIDDVKVTIASCCKPIKGDRIIGYISKTHGITIHRMVCPNVEDLDDRFIEVEWNESVIKKYPTVIIIRAIDDVLMDIVAKASTSTLMIDKIKSLSNNTYELTVSTPNKEVLTKYINDLNIVPNIKEVKRLIK